MEPIRIAMWSGPRNISTAMMRAFENRPHTAVIDEPFYAAYLAATGIDHPMRDGILASQPTDPRAVVATLLGPVPGGASVFYQKHMTHHMLQEFDLDFMASCKNVFLIRAPDRVIASYARKREQATLADLGFARQLELFEREADRLGAAPPVIDADEFLQQPRLYLTSLCIELNISFWEKMLSWPSGRRTTDGIWAAHWYGAVENSTCFSPAQPSLPSTDCSLARSAWPYYQRMYAHRLSPQ